jgi:pyruvate/2-oxoacid:ferredoxin oxidoreductase beta subunit
MNKFIAPFIFSTFSFIPCFSMECNAKKLDAIVNGFVAKIEANIPITHQHIIQALTHCDEVLSDDQKEKEQEETSLDQQTIPYQSETASNLKNTMKIFSEMQNSYPEKKLILTQISKDVLYKVQQNHEKQKRLSEWRKNDSQNRITSSPQNQVSTQHNNSLLNLFANADVLLSKKK